MLSSVSSSLWSIVNVQITLHCSAGYFDSNCFTVTRASIPSAIVILWRRMMNLQHVLSLHGHQSVVYPSVTLLLFTNDSVYTLHLLLLFLLLYSSPSKTSLWWTVGEVLWLPTISASYDNVETPKVWFFLLSFWRKAFLNEIHQEYTSQPTSWFRSNIDGQSYQSHSFSSFICAILTYTAPIWYSWCKLWTSIEWNI